MPISRVRSVTDSSMMFMMPMPPTSSDTAGDAGEQRRHRAGGAIERLPELLERHLLQPADVADDRARDVGTHAAFGQRLTRLRRDGEVVRLVVADPVAGAQQLRSRRS